VEDVERWAVDIIRVAEGMPGEEDDSPEELKKRILPMLLPETATDPDMAMIVTQPLVAGLRVGYAVDSERTISYVSQPALERLQLTLDDIHQIALDNLVARSDAINAHAANRRVNHSGFVNGNGSCTTMTPARPRTGAVPDR
jgi:uncharacterized protein YtpQ (UPF0354 family)